MSDYLPLELVTEILKKLPVKSLLRFRCVCKTWRSLITSPDFITMHLNQTTSISTNNTIHRLVRHYSKVHRKEIYSLHFDNETLDDTHAGIEFPFEGKSKFYFRVVGSCNGLLCLSDDLFGYTDIIILWNPSIRRSLVLPVPRFSFDYHGPCVFALGFGFDPNTNDHKIVRVGYVQIDDGYIVPPVVEVFALSSGTWRGIKKTAVVPYCIINEHYWSQAFVNGVVHWVAYHLSVKNGDRTFRSLIVSFDMGSEEFGELNLPENLAGVLPVNMSTAMFGGSLSIFQYDRRICTNSCSIWVMKEYGIVGSWSNYFNIDIEGGLGKALGLRTNGEILLAARSGELVSYNYGTETSMNIGICGTKDSFYVDSYKESLILLKEGNKVLGREASMGGGSASSSSEDESEGEDNEVETSELWMQSVVIQFLTALLNEP